MVVPVLPGMTAENFALSIIDSDTSCATWDELWLTDSLNLLNYQKTDVTLRISVV